MLQRPVCLYLENSFANKKIMSQTSSVSGCFIKCLLFLKISPNCETLFYKTFTRNLACSALKVSKTFIIACLLRFALL